MNANGTRLAALTKELWGQWQQTKQYWKDSKSEAFEQKYLDELVASIDKTVPWQGKATATLTVKNNGSAPATVNIGEQPGGFQLLTKGGAPLTDDQVKAVAAYEYSLSHKT